MNALGRVLIIDDEAGLRHTLTRVLQKAGFDVSGAPDGTSGLNLIQGAAYDLIYLDIHLPDLGGLEVLQQIRQTNPDVAVILFTAHASLQSALTAIRLGASDYLVKPVDPDVFVARTRVILEEQAVERRKRQLREQIADLRAELRDLETGAGSAVGGAEPLPSPDHRFLKKGEFILDLQAQRATLGERVLKLPPTAFQYLVVLVRHAPEAVDYQTLVVESQGYEVEPSEASELAKYHIHILRQELAVDAEQAGYLLTIRSVGYRLLTE